MNDEVHQTITRAIEVLHVLDRTTPQAVQESMRELLAVVRLHHPGAVFPRINGQLERR